MIGVYLVPAHSRQAAKEPQGKPLQSETITARRNSDESNTSGTSHGIHGMNIGRSVMQQRNVHFLSQTVEWPTPKAVYDALDREFNFDFDLCPYGGTEDGLATLFCSWKDKRVFVNPPYGKGMDKWLERGLDADLAVYLIPARTDTRWFHDIVLKNAVEIRFIKGRLKFGDATNSAPFPSMLVIFRGNHARR